LSVIIIIFIPTPWLRHITHIIPVKETYSQQTYIIIPHGLGTPKYFGMFIKYCSTTQRM